MFLVQLEVYKPRPNISQQGTFGRHMFPCIVNIQLLSLFLQMATPYWFSSPAHLFWRYLLPNILPHYSHLWNSLPDYLKSERKLRMCCLPHTFPMSIQGQYGLHMFDVLRAEQDDGILQCNHSAIRKCCNNCFDMYKCELLM